MTKRVSQEVKEKSKLTKEEWREYTKTVWSIANTKHDDHPAVFPEEIPFRLAKLFSFYGETVLDPPREALQGLERPHALSFLSDGVRFAWIRTPTTSAP